MADQTAAAARTAGAAARKVAAAARTAAAVRGRWRLGWNGGASWNGCMDDRGGSSDGGGGSGSRVDSSDSSRITGSGDNLLPFEDSSRHQCRGHVGSPLHQCAALKISRLGTWIYYVFY